MHIMYIDEAGCPGALPSPTSPVQPIFLISALIIDSSNLYKITKEILNLKRNIYKPTLKFEERLKISKDELKGSDLKKDLRYSGGKYKYKQAKRRAKRFIDELLKILEKYNVRILSRIYIKPPGGIFDGLSVYTSAVQCLYADFNNFLSEKDSQGFVIADNRTLPLNEALSHSLFTEKNKLSGDKYPLVCEMPTFGQSHNHIMLQMTDIVSSALVMPISSHSHCTGHVFSDHVNADNLTIKNDYANKIKSLFYRYMKDGRMKGGLTVNDKIMKKSSSHFFK